MAINASNFPTLLDIVKASDTDGKITAVTEILNETNEILEDMSWKEGNLPTGERTTIRTGLPKPAWRSFNEFVTPTKGETAQATFNCGMLEAYSEVDTALAELNDNTAAFRLLEDRAHIESMGQEITNTIFYGDESVNPRAFTGLAAYYASTTATNGDNVIDGKNAFSANAAAAADDLSSIWLINWGDGVHGVVPKGSVGGLKRNDLGKQLIQGTSDTATNRDASPGRMESYVTHYRWDAGLAKKNWKHVVRIANVSQDVSGTHGVEGTTSVTPAFQTLAELMYQAYVRMHGTGSGRMAWYMSRPILMKFQQQLSRLTSESSLKTEMIGGKMMMSWMGMPIRICDALSGGQNATAGSNEAVIT